MTGYELKKIFFGENINTKEAARVLAFLAAHPGAKCSYAQPPEGATAQNPDSDEEMTCDCCGAKSNDITIRIGIGGYSGIMYTLTDSAVVCCFCIAKLGRCNDITAAQSRKIQKFAQWRGAKF